MNFYESGSFSYFLVKISFMTRDTTLFKIFLCWFGALTKSVFRNCIAPVNGTFCIVLQIQKLHCKNKTLNTISSRIHKTIIVSTTSTHPKVCGIFVSVHKIFKWNCAVGNKVIWRYGCVVEHRDPQTVSSHPVSIPYRYVV